MTATDLPDRELLGCDFSSSPSTRKNIVLASGRLCGQRVQLLNTERFSTLDSWQQRLSQGPWLGGFDLPFGLPRELVHALDWPTDWLACVQHFAAQSRADLRQQFKAFCDARPAGQKFAHRATDRPAGSSPSMKWVNPPVAWMMHAGVPRLLAVGAWLPAHQPDPGRTASGAGRVALEAYPGLLARELLGGSTSYKSDDPARQTPERQQARRHMLDALAAGHTRLDLQLELTPAQAEALVADASGDALDAVLCLVQVAWAGQRGAYGLPAHVDPLEGWITSA
jgi:hypothetical protein